MPIANVFTQYTVSTLQNHDLNVHQNYSPKQFWIKMLFEQVICKSLRDEDKKYKLN